MKDLKNFEFGTIKRSQIKFADYNPRKIDKSNQDKLINAIKDHGLIEPVVWNQRTGVLVGGHQRLTAAD
ncbi:ParB N-terminal domain-containing protein, partial [Lactobacillus pasteurii]